MHWTGYRNKATSVANPYWSSEQKEEEEEEEEEGEQQQQQQQQQEKNNKKNNKFSYYIEYYLNIYLIAIAYKFFLNKISSFVCVSFSSSWHSYKNKTKCYAKYC